MTYPAKHISNNKGFTLTELIMVLVLISIVATIALPRFFGRASFDERALFDDTLNAVRYSQKLAVATGCKIRVTFDNSRYQVLHENSCGSDSFTNQLAVKHPADPDQGYTGSQANVVITAANDSTTFNALGQAEANNTIIIGNRQLSIIAETGFSYDSSS